MRAMTKEEVIAGPSCLTRSADDEPVFVLCARDPIAAKIIRAWCEEARKTGHHELGKIRRAEEEANDFDRWHAEKKAAKAIR